MNDRSAAVRTRREPPPFRRCAVARAEDRSPTMRRLTLAGEELVGLEPALPAASVRVLLPADGGEVEIPTWQGNEFLAADGSRPRIRTLTPLRIDPVAGEVDVEVVLHDDSPLTAWARGASAGTGAALSGTGRGYEIDPEATSFVLVGDESAVPAISTVLAALPAGAAAHVVVERRAGAAAIDLSAPGGGEVVWVVLGDGDAPGDAMVAAVEALDLAALADAEGAGLRVWAAGEAAAVQRIRRHCFDGVGLARSQAVIRGYWKRGRAESA